MRPSFLNLLFGQLWNSFKIAFSFVVSCSICIIFFASVRSV
uniref:Uncharacterized protein n=1 Tax=Anopheles albimanus TaxID=7167 RepID=A0A182FZJ5_ANOAL